MARVSIFCRRSLPLTTHLPLVPSTLVSIPDVFSLSTAVTTRDLGTFNRSAIADMESVYRRPDEFRTMLPTFFFKHLDFFRQFTITIQFIESGERLSTNITLNYKVKA